MSALDELLSPNNFPPCDPVRGDAVRELDALRTELAMLRSLLPDGGCCAGSNPNCYGPRGCLVRALEVNFTPGDVLLARAENAEVELRCARIVLDRAASLMPLDREDRSQWLSEASLFLHGSRPAAVNTILKNEARDD